MATNTGEQLITIDPDIFDGAPVLAGTRLRLSVLFDDLRAGLTIDEIVDAYPSLSKELVLAVLENPDQVQRAQAAQAANSIMQLDGPPLTSEVAAVMNRIISGEITTEQAVQLKIDEIKGRQRMLVTQEMIDSARKIDPAKIRASTVEEIRHLMHRPRETKRNVDFIEGDEIFPIPMYVTRPREHQIIKSAHITASGETLTAQLSNGEVETGTLDEIVQALRFRLINAHEITMSHKDAEDAPTTGQRIALLGALKKRNLIGPHLLIDRADFASAEELVGRASLQDLVRWIRADETFAIEHEGADLYPLYSFENGQRLSPRPMMRKILASLSMDPWHAAWWFSAGYGMLDGRRPQDVLESDPEAVLAAARDQAMGITHG